MTKALREFNIHPIIVKNIFRKALLVPLITGWFAFTQHAIAQTGYLVREVYPSDAGLLQFLTNNPAFPDAPREVGVLAEFEAPQDFDNNYGQRVSGYLLPPVTGDYTFWISSDDQSALFLSTDESPDRKSVV